jgi:DNA mismatch repair ATPase MutS
VTDLHAVWQECKKRHAGDIVLVRGRGGKHYSFAEDAETVAFYGGPDVKYSVGSVAMASFPSDILERILRVLLANERRVSITQPK